ncbi:hypothetical protein H6P81_018888 [Aristolochia fimbriata]|uniref:Nucleolar 27S pre-rRNA processing Urb2/Npa2 C-terminal domain-containing protein n=1 Tax=Aristolochia fimbriata TaxID=158543 RepID=A0AAV7E4C7_ARIFI|nr:hypothetical protein H6P81_018888 [Aristolochia fimbriata]
MAEVQAACGEDYRKKNKKRKVFPDADDRRPKAPCARHAETEVGEEEESVVTGYQRTPQGRHVWKNLDFILSLESKQIQLQRKIEFAYDFITSPRDTDQLSLDAVPLPRLVSFLCNWVQSVLVSPEKIASKEVGVRHGVLEDTCLDHRCWKIFYFCLKESSQQGISLSFTPNLLRAVTRAVRSLLDSNKLPELLPIVTDTVSLLFSSHGRSVNANIDVWTSLSVSVFDLLNPLLTGCISDHDTAGCMRLSTIVLEPFTNYLKAYPSPKNIFPSCVDRLLVPSLELLSLSNLPNNLLKIVESILSNGLFHPAHIDGFLGIRSSEKYMGSEEGSKGLKTGIIKSYHKHLFQKLQQLPPVKKRSIGHLLLLFVEKVKKQKETSLASPSDQKSSADALRELEEDVSKLMFNVFVQFMEPLLFDLKEFSKIKCSRSKMEEIMLSDALPTLQSINKILDTFTKEKMYVRTEDTVEGAHYNFLKEVYSAVVLFSTELNSFISSALERRGTCSQILLHLAKEVIVAVRFFTEIEHRVIENDLVGLWTLMLSYQAIDQSLASSQGGCMLGNEVVHLGCQMIHVYSELRQVDNPIYALCKAARIFGSPVDKNETGPSRFEFPTSFLHLRAFVGSVAKMICSQEFRVAIAEAIKSVPEGQVGGFVRLLKTDVTESLEWIKHGCSLAAEKDSEDPTYDLSMQTELVGKCLCELYTVMLDASNVTVGNSVIVGNSLKDLMTDIEPCLSCLVGKQSDDIDKFLFSVFSAQIVLGSTSISWIFVLFFRLYASCRSLYRQAISLMPPSSSVKAATVMGDLCTTCSGQDWMDESLWEDEGYFSWIVKPSASLLDIIQSVKKVCLQNLNLTCTPLIYVLNIMSIQRLVDLNRKIKALEFLQEWDALGHLSEKKHKRWKQILVHSTQEATELTGFVTGYLNTIVKPGKVKSVSRSVRTPLTHKNDAWDLCVSSMTVDSAPTAIWWLLCQNVDVWCAHATKTDLKKFLSILFHHSLPLVNSFRFSGDSKMDKARCLGNVTQHFISLSLLSDTIIYEQTFVHRYLKSRLHNILKKSLSPLMSSDIDFTSLPDWSEALTSLQNASVLGRGTESSMSEGASVVDPESYLPHVSSTACHQEHVCVDLEACHSLLYLLCWMPKGQANAKHFLDWAIYILNIERLVVPHILEYRACKEINNCIELINLFLCCRRALRYITAESAGKELEAGKPSLISGLFNNSLPIMWLFKSVFAVAALSSALPEANPAKPVNSMIFSLMDHTSQIFFVLGETQTMAACGHQINGNFAHEDDKKDDQSKGGEGTNCNEFTSSWRCVEHTAETLKEQTQSLLLNDSIQKGKSSWSQVSSLLSCVYGFLWGQISALTEENFRLAKKSIMRTNRGLIFEFNQHMVIFEDFVSHCLKLVFQDNTEEPGNSCDSVTGEIRLEVALITGFRFFEGEFNCLKKVQKPDMVPETVADDFSESSGFKIGADLFEVCHLNKVKMSLLRSFYEGENPEMAFFLRQFFLTSAALLHLKNIIPFPSRSKQLKNIKQPAAITTVMLLGILCFVMSEFAETVESFFPSSLICLDGAIKYLEVLGCCFPSLDPVLSRNLYTKIIQIHLKAIGKCISLQGKAATLASHEMESSIKTLELLEGTSNDFEPINDKEQYSVNNIKTLLRKSFKTYVRKPRELHFLSAVQTLEGALVGVHESCHAYYDISTGGVYGGMVSTTVSGAIDCLDLLLESTGGSKHLSVIKRHIHSFINTLLNIIVHLQSPLIFCEGKLNHIRSSISPDPGSVILMCVEVLTRVSGKHYLFSMDSSHVSQLLHLPTTLFKYVLQLREMSCAVIFSINKEARHLDNQEFYNVDRHFFVTLYAAACRLLCTTMRHRKSGYGRCIGLLEDSVCHLLYCLETVGADLVSQKVCLSLQLQEATKCASFLRRVYEEVRQQKDILGQEIDEALRPGLYALIDVCSPDDLQQLHTELGEGPCRSTLANLQHDYKFNFQYEGKV